jgi:DNA mismatch endonuclease (patch repair protein)
MARVRGTNTKPEMFVRRTLHSMGYRFRLHRRDLPGKPDIVLPNLNTAIFVHGCYWHRHAGCKRATMPHTRTEFWENKFARTIVRDKEHHEKLTGAGWNVVTIWECELRDGDEFRKNLKSKLGTRTHHHGCHRVAHIDRN